MPSQVLPDGVLVGSVSSLPTCDSSIAGKVVFNTSDNKMYYCDGTNWNAIGG